MTQLVYTNILTPLPAPTVAVLRSYVGGANLKLTVGQSIIALVGDAPGTPANVQLTEAPKGQSNARANGWAADNAGALTMAVEGITLGKGGRPYENDEFFALLAAYAAPLNIVGAVGGGTFPGTIELGPESRALLAAIPEEFDRYADGKKQSS